MNDEVLMKVKEAVSDYIWEDIMDRWMYNPMQCQEMEKAVRGYSEEMASGEFTEEDEKKCQRIEELLSEVSELIADMYF